jgi:hypothetical protein
LATSLARLDERSTRLEDERAILDTLHRYVHTIDSGAEADWVDCFTEDAVWVTRRAPLAAGGAAEHRICGHAELAALVAGFPRPPIIWHRHMLVDPRIEIEGDRCHVESFFLVPTAHRTGPYISSFGRYRDRLVRCSDGRWRFEERVAEVDGAHPLREPLLGNDVTESLVIEAVKRLRARYCHYLDAKRWPEWLELFTENAQIRLAPAGELLVEGRHAILERVSLALVGVTTVHEVTMPDIEITGPTSARGTWSTFSIIATDSSDASASSEHRWGRHEEEYELGDDRQWRIRSILAAHLRVERR